MMVVGPRLGTLVGTPEPMPMCAPRAHIVFTLVGVKHFARLGRREKREAQGRPRHWFEDIVFHIARGYLLDIRR